MTRSPLWASAFRPFYLLGSAYAPLLAAIWLAAWFGLLPTPGGMPLKLLHGHEFVFGFAAAIILGIVVTALPSWAGTDEVAGGRLAVLVALWIAGRAAFWLSPWLRGSSATTRKLRERLAICRSKIQAGMVQPGTSTMVRGPCPASM